MRVLAVFLIVPALALAKPLVSYDLRAREHVGGGRSADVTIDGRRTALPDGSTGVRSAAATEDGKYIFFVHSIGRYALPVTQLDHGWVNTAALSVFEAASGRRINTVLLDDPARGAANPWGIAVNARWIAVSHAGTHEVSVIDRAKFLWRLLSFRGDATTDLGFMKSIGRRRIQLRGKGPRGISFRNDGKLEVKLHFAEAIAVIDPETGRVDEPDLPNGLSPAVARDPVRLGEFYFNDAAICFQSWQSCASCHIDGADDGLVWDFPNSGGGLGHPEATVNLTKLRGRSPFKTGRDDFMVHVYAAPASVRAATEAYVTSLSRAEK